MPKPRFYLTLFCVLLLGLTSCNKDEPIQDELSVEFDPASGYGTSINETFLPGGGCEFDILVSTNCKWIVNKNTRLRMNPTFGDSGTTKVHCTLPKSGHNVIKDLKLEFLYGSDGYTSSETYVAYQLAAPTLLIEPDSRLIFPSGDGQQTVRFIANQIASPHFDLTTTAEWASIEYVPNSTFESGMFEVITDCVVKCQPNTSGKVRETRIICLIGGPGYETEDECSRTLVIVQDK